MLGYLDNEANRKGVPNENYARELLELHTLGVDGGYTQKDVEEVARCLTGWTIETVFCTARHFRFDEPATTTAQNLSWARHPGRRWRKRRQPRSGNRQPPPGHRAPHRRKLCRYFWAKTATKPELDAQTGRTFTRTDGDIKAMLRPLLLSDELRHGPPILKRPLDFVASSLRALNADTDGGLALQQHLSAMGQPAPRVAASRRLPGHHPRLGRLPSRPLELRLRLTGGQIKGTRAATCPLSSRRPAAITPMPCSP
jgi:hypothetical protein